LLREELVERRGYLVLEKVYRRAVTLKTLPEAGTGYFSTEQLLGLAELDATGRGRPFPFWLATTVRIQPQSRARFMLNARHGLVENLRNAVPFLADKSIAKQTADAAVTGGIKALFEELAAMSSKLVSLSVTVLLEGNSLEQLEARTEVARSAFSKAGNSELLLEEVSQLPAFLSVLPGAGNYQFRRKTCTSRNAGDFLPVFAPWRGCGRAVSLLQSPTGEAFRFDPFDMSLSPAHHEAHSPAGEVRGGGDAGDRLEACGEGCARHRGGVRERIERPRAVRVRVEQLHHCAEPLVAHRAEPARLQLGRLCTTRPERLDEHELRELRRRDPRTGERSALLPLEALEQPSERGGLRRRGANVHERGQGAGEQVGLRGVERDDSDQQRAVLLVGFRE
jgi:hypothetical protein